MKVTIEVSEKVANKVRAMITFCDASGPVFLSDMAGDEYILIETMKEVRGEVPD